MSVGKIVRGGVVSPQGFEAGAIYSGIKRPAPKKRDLGLLFSTQPCAVGATFTTNSAISPTLTLNKQTLELGGDIHAVVASSGCANTAVGEQGMHDARSMAQLTAKRFGVDPQQVMVATTGLIGVELPIQLIREHIPQIKCDREGGTEFAYSIMTTDSEPKECAVEFTLDGKKITIGGAAKGSGMIHPNMATLLVFLTTDANVDRGFLQKVLSETVKLTFNQIDIDGDQSTNDMALLLANGAAGNDVIKEGGKGADAFKEALLQICCELTHKIAADGEGARKVIHAVVEGAANASEARRGTRAIVSSALVKTAIYGRDPNWGRVVAAVGSSGIELEMDKLQIFLNGIQIVDKGCAIPFNTQAIVGSLAQTKVVILVKLNIGDGVGQAWGCELSEEYVIINSAYTT